MILSFAVSGLFLVGNNLLTGDPTVIIEESDHESGGALPAINMQNLED